MRSSVNDTFKKHLRRVTLTNRAVSLFRFHKNMFNKIMETEICKICKYAIQLCVIN